VIDALARMVSLTRRGRVVRGSHVTYSDRPLTCGAVQRGHEYRRLAVDSLLLAA